MGLDALFGSLTAGGYESESWAAFEAARSAADDFVAEYPANDTMTRSQFEQYRDLAKAYWLAAYSLRSAGDATVTVYFSDDFGMRYPEYAMRSSEAKQVVLSGDSSLKALLTEAGLAGLDHLGVGYSYDSGGMLWDGWLVYVNGVLVRDPSWVEGTDVSNTISFSASSMDHSVKWTDIFLRDGDIVTLARVEEALIPSYVGAQGVYFEYKTDYYGQLALRLEKSTVEEGESLTASIYRMNSYLLSYDGRESFYADAALAAYGPRNEDGSYPAEPVLSDENGVLTLYKAGEYLVTAFEPRAQDMNDREYPNLTVSALPVTVMVTSLSADELGQEKNDYLAQVDAALAACDKEAMGAEPYSQAEAAAAEAKATIENAASLEELRQILDNALAAINGLKDKAELINNKALSLMTSLLMLLPDTDEIQAGLFTQADAGRMENAKTQYAALTDYQRKQLTRQQSVQWDALTDAWGEDGSSLPEKKEYTFTIRVEGNYGDQLQFVTLNKSSYSYIDTKSVYNEETGKWETVQDDFWHFSSVRDENDFEEKNINLAEPKTFTVGTMELVNFSFSAPYSDEYEVYDVKWEGAGADDVIITRRENNGNISYSLSHYMSNISSNFLNTIIDKRALRGNVTVTIYTRSSEDIEAVRSAAEAELKNAFESYNKSNYEQSTWTELVTAYNEGVEKIHNAETADAIVAAKRDAITAMGNVVPRSDDNLGSIHVKVENTTWTDAPEMFRGMIAEGDVKLQVGKSMMYCILSTLEEAGYSWTGTGGTGYNITYLSSIYLDENKNGKLDKDEPKLSEFDGGSMSGWMGCLNDWFTNEGFQGFTPDADNRDYRIVDGDEISVMYTVTGYGSDLGGTWGNSDTSLKELTVTGGELVPTFISDTTDYALILTEGAVSVKPTATNKNYQVRTFLNEMVTVTGTDYYRRGETIPVQAGETIYIGVGERAWPSMNKTGAQARPYSASWYAVRVINAENGADYVNELIAKLPAEKNINSSNYEAVKEQIDAIDAVIAELSAGEQAKVNSDALEAVRKAVEGFEAVADLQKKLAELPSDMKATKAELQAVKDAYDALNETQKGLLTVADTNKAERAIKALNGIIQEETAAEKQARLAAVKKAIEKLDFTVAQADANDAETLAAYANSVLAGVQLDEGMTAVLTVTDVTCAAEGTADNEKGTDGSYTVNVALTLDDQSATATVTGAAITATAYVAPEPGKPDTPDELTYTEALAAVQDYIKTAVPSPIVGSTKGEWAVFALNRGGAADADWNAKYLAALQTYVAENDGKLHDVKYTEYSRVVLALTSMGVDATQFKAGEKTYDLVSPLLDKQNNGAYWAEWQGNNGTAFALLAVDSHNYLDNADGKALRAGLIASLKANQLESGAWSISGESADLDVTAAAVYALAPYLNAERASAVGVSVSDVQTMVNNALAYLSDRQNETGGYGSAEADGWVVIALSTLGRDAYTDEQFVKDGKSVLDDLLSYYDKTTGGFKHLANGSVDQMASEQAAYDLVAYDRCKTSKTALYDMSDVEIKTNAPESADEADKAAAAAVDAKIDAIGEVTLESETAITAARTAYDALTDAQKALVTKLAELTVAEAKLEALKNKDNKPDKDKDKTITVTMRLIGAEKATKDVDLGADSYLPNYVTWIPTTSYTLEKGSTVYDLWTTATADYSIRSVGAENNYVETVYAPSGYALSEFTNGPRSGWMYTINGRHPGFGLVEQELHEGDRVIWHYVNDYSYEVEDWFGGDPNYPALGDGTYWNLWLKAPDSTGSTGGGVEGGDKKDEKKDSASGGGTTSDSNTVIADDGSTVTVETEKSVETKKNEDGSVTEVVTETTKTTVVAPDGSVSTTETAVETETTTNSVKNADGTVTETEQTVEKVTETVTGADGKTQTTVTETEETKQLNTTTSADGKVSGTGTYSATSTVTVDGKKTTAVTEGTVAVSTDDKGTVSEVTNAKTTVTAADGTKTETTTVTTEAEMANGTTGKVVADGEGNTISAEASVSQAALEAAVKSGEPIEIPVTVNAASGATVSISIEGATGDGKAWVEIGTTDTAPGNVAYLKLADGVTKLLTTCKTGSVIVPVEGSCEVIVKDNSKSFSDVDGASWYGDSVTFVTARSIFNGNGDGTFAPTATMNRAMAAQILYNLDGSAKAGDGTSFSDVSADDWFNGAVGWASGLGVITGYDGAYNPLNAVTRQDLVTILYRYAKAAGYDVSAGSSVNLLSYADGADVKDYAAEAMRWAIANGIIGGYTDGTLRPRNTATRAEVAAIMQRMVQNAVK